MADPPTGPPADPVTVLAVDDQPQNLRLLAAVLEPRGYRVRTASSGEEALAALERPGVDLVLLDIVMPGLDGFEVCRRIRATDATAFLPVVMITASGAQQKRTAIEAGADDFVGKPFDQGELLARVASLARLKRYHDTIARQAAELAAWNVELEARVSGQIAQLERLQRLRRFLSPQLADLVVDSGDESFLDSHRREIVVVFCDLRGFTRFAESAEPEEVMGVLGEYHRELGGLIHEYGGTLERFTGDGLMVFFNDPLPCPDPARRAVDMAVAMRRCVHGLAQGWSRAGHDLGFGVGIAQGYATLGRIGFEGRFDYAAIGSVTNLAARLCAAAGPGQVLVSRRVWSAVEDDVPGTPVGELDLRGFSRPVPAFAVEAPQPDTRGQGPDPRDHAGARTGADVTTHTGGSR
jgi:adenylate cyclase